MFRIVSARRLIELEERVERLEGELIRNGIWPNCLAHDVRMSRLERLAEALGYVYENRPATGRWVHKDDPPSDSSS